MEVVKEGLKIDSQWILEKYKGDIKPGDKPFETRIVKGNLGLNEGITEILNLITGLGTPTAYNNANARIGIGDSDVAAEATQTGLQAATNKIWKAMDSGYPTVAAQTVTFRVTTATSEANWAWKEYTVVNAADDSGKNVNRKVEPLGTKPNTESWVLSLQMTVT